MKLSKFMIVMIFSLSTIIFLRTRYDNEVLMQMVKPYFDFHGGFQDESAQPIDENNIFFLETSTSEAEYFNLSVRQACSIESAAKMNPGRRIYLLVLSKANFSSITKDNLNILSTYKNIAIRRISVEDYLKDTPIEEWWKSGIMKTSVYPTVHTSDVLRLVTLWKFGGIYLDLDVIVMKSLENVTNFAGFESDDVVNNAVLGLSSTGVGEQFLNASFEDLKANFNGTLWGQHGPQLVTRVAKKLCQTESLREVTIKKTCGGFTVYPTSAFYSIPWNDWELLFSEGAYLSTMNKLNESFAAHMWNFLSSSTRVKVGGPFPYSTLASKYCPKIYNSLDGFF